MTIGIIFGGKSYEHEISIVSAIVLSKTLNKDLKFIFLSLEEKFYLIEQKDLKAINFSSEKYKKSKELFINKKGFSYKKIFGDININCDMFINLIHGAYGEEGIASAFLDFYKLNYIGPRIDACALSYNKYITKIYANSINIKTLDYEIINKQNISTKLSFPIIIKPCRGGSSLGVNIANNQSELEYYAKEAFEYDDDVIIEPYIENIKEYNLAGCYTTKMNYSNIEEPEKGDILDFDKKYMDFNRDKKLSLPKIPQKLANNMQTAFLNIYGTIFKGAIIRCDFFVINDEVYLNEINPIPGSMAHYLFDDFNTIIDDMFFALIKKRDIQIDYNYINNINKAKG